MKKLLILDANSIVNRAFYAVRPLTTKEGLNTNAIFGFLNILFKYVEEISPDYIAAAFDISKPTFRHKMYDGYKATRHKMPDELREQMPVLKEVLTALNIKIYEKEGYEADDVIGTVSRICEENGVCCSILTGDKDDLQLASKNVLIHLVTTRMGQTTTEVFDDDKVFQKYGVTPTEFIDLKAIMGDSSDNIPGVFGIGEKGAINLISAYHSIDGVYENIEEIKGATKQKLIDSKDNAYLSKTLATIDRHVPMDFCVLENEIKSPDNSALFELFTRLEFNSFIKKMNLSSEKHENNDIFKDAEFKTVTDSNELKSLLKNENICFLIDKESKSVSFCFDKKKAFSASLKENIGVFKEFFESCKNKATHGLKDEILYLKENGIDVKNVDFDSEIAAYLIDAKRKNYDLADLVFSYLGAVIEEKDDGGTQLSLDSLLCDTKKSDTFMKKALAIFSLKEYELDLLEKNESLRLFNTIEMPLVYVLADMEAVGAFVDRERLIEFGDKLKSEIERLTLEIYDLAGHEFNINSPKQLGVVLFQELGLTTNKKTKSGYSTNAEVLEKLKYEHEIVEKILEYRKVSKLNSTYVEGLFSVINKKTKRVHSNFNQTVTVTGRISSTEPNLQNIPVRTELGREMRKMFTSENEDSILVDADYSQIELRVLAHIANDKNMIDAFLSEKDIHASTAAKVFGISEENVTPDMRSAAKAINFGLVYGMGEFSLSQDLKISVKAAKEYINDYLGSYPNVKKYMSETKEFAKEHGYVKTMFGRRREIPEILSSNYQVRSFGERAAMNSPIQGTAADIIKLAMINVHKKLKEEKLKSKLILQVHDELIIEALKSEEEQVKEILKSEMEKAAELKVPLKVDLKTGHSWYDTK